MAQKFFNAYNPKPISPGLDFTGHEEVCNQQLAEECEVRSLISRFEAGKIQDLPAVRVPVYNDKFLNPTSFAEAKAMIDNVRNDFYSLPAETQRKFGSIENYVSDLYKISQGNAETIAKYSNVNIANAPESVSQTTSASISATSDNAGASGIASSSLSRSDTKTE